MDSRVLKMKNPNLQTSRNELNEATRSHGHAAKALIEHVEYKTNRIDAFVDDIRVGGGGDRSCQSSGLGKPAADTGLSRSSEQCVLALENPLIGTHDADEKSLLGANAERFSNLEENVTASASPSAEILW